MKIPPVGEELFHADRRMEDRPDLQTDRYHEANSRFLYLCERAKNSWS